jgi:hypothetical protein
MTPRPDFIAGNTRLRARLPALLGPAEYDQLAGLPRETVVERLAASTYRLYLNRDHPVERQLLDAVGRRQRDLLRGVRGLYGGIAGIAVAVLLARHDLQDALALMRGARTGQAASVRLTAVMGVGAIDQAPAADIAAAPDGAAAVLRLTSNQLPDALTARVLPTAWGQYELHGDPDEFETAVASAAIDGWLDRLEWVGRPARPVLDLILAECDRANLLAVLRDPAAEPPRLLPAGLVAESALMAARQGDPQAAVATRPEWRGPLERHLRDKDHAVLEGELDVAVWRQAVRGLRRGDPLGADIPVGYVLAAECEARAVRLLLTGLGPAYHVRDLLVP